MEQAGTLKDSADIYMLNIWYINVKNLDSYFDIFINQNRYFDISISYINHTSLYGLRYESIDENNSFLYSE